MNRQELFNQVMEQLTKDKDIMDFVEQLRLVTKDSSTVVENSSSLYQSAEKSMPLVSSRGLPEPYLQLLQKTVQTTLEAALGADETLERERFIGQSFNRFNDVYKALS
ncbi:MAG: hypothetical protein ACRBFS_08855 [Aureispira sp.]